MNEKNQIERLKRLATTFFRKGETLDEFLAEYDVGIEEYKRLCSLDPTLEEFIALQIQKSTSWWIELGRKAVTGTAEVEINNEIVPIKVDSNLYKFMMESVIRYTPIQSFQKPSLETYNMVNGGMEIEDGVAEA